MTTNEVTKAAKAAMKQDSDEEISFFDNGSVRLEGVFTLAVLEEICAALRCLET